jgi:hypothetical protein
MVLINIMEITIITKQTMFPSPCGDYGSYLLNECLPLRYDVRVVSVPLRGLWFLSLVTVYNHQLVTDSSFRPLAGIMVLIFQGGF